MRAKQLLCQYYPKLLDEKTEGVEVMPDEWKIVRDTQTLFSKNFLTCIAVIAILKEPGQDGRAALYLYHKLTITSQKQFMSAMLSQGVERVYIFSKTADILGKHHNSVLKMIQAFTEVIDNAKVTIAIHRVEVPAYNMIFFSPLTQEISIGSKSTTTADGTQIFLNYSQVLEKLNHWDDQESSGFNEGGSDEDESKTQRFFNAILSESKTDDSEDTSTALIDQKAQLIEKIANDILDHQAEDGGDAWSIKVYKAAARTLSCRVIVESKADTHVLVIEPAAIAVTTSIYLKDLGDQEYQRLKTIELQENKTIRITALPAAKAMSEAEFSQAYQREQEKDRPDTSGARFIGAPPKKTATPQNTSTCCKCIIL